VVKGEEKDVESFEKMMGGESERWRRTTSDGKAWAVRNSKFQKVFHPSARTMKMDDSFVCGPRNRQRLDDTSIASSWKAHWQSP
jgi:hypothetical protein